MLGYRPLQILTLDTSKTVTVTARGLKLSQLIEGNKKCFFNLYEEPSFTHVYIVLTQRDYALDDFFEDDDKDDYPVIFF